MYAYVSRPCKYAVMCQHWAGSGAILAVSAQNRPSSGMFIGIRVYYGPRPLSPSNPAGDNTSSWPLVASRGMLTARARGHMPCQADIADLVTHEHTRKCTMNTLRAASRTDSEMQPFTTFYCMR